MNIEVGDDGSVEVEYLLCNYEDLNLDSSSHVKARHSAHIYNLTLK